MEPSIAVSPDTRVIIVHQPEVSVAGAEDGGVEGEFFHLLNPQNGSPACYLLVNGRLQELHWFKQRYSSWFLGNAVCEDGSLYFATSFDPLFMVLPILEAARMKKEEDLGKFRSLVEMMCVDGYPGYMRLVPLLTDCIQVICEVREVGACKYYRLDDQMVLAWLLCKVRRIAEGLQATQKNMSSLSNEDINLYAVGLLSEYIPAKLWLSMLCDRLSVNLEHVKNGRSGAAMEATVTPPSLVVAKQPGSGLSKSGSGKKGASEGVRKITSFFARPR